jgi:alpha-glucosidase
MAEWWRGATIYQVYPRSFLDTDGDGIGDLKGITSKLDYIASLGVAGVWVSPFFASPMKDFGYDVSDYCAIDPIFGAMEDFDALLSGLHARGLKLIIDQVWSHTSDQHDWFRQSRQDKTNPKADWYVWADARPDGTPPNNWLSVFGGPAWTWDTRRQQYYLHNFLTSQPDLNFHNPAVRAAILDVARFWLEKGVDGFRLDVANMFFHDAGLADNPPKRATGGFARPYAHQQHIHDKSRPEALAFMADLRALTDTYPEKMMVGEIFDDDYITRAMAYCAPDHLHTAYNFLFLEAKALSAARIAGAIGQWIREDAWPSWSFSNHDVVRVPTRWQPPGSGRDEDPRFAMLLNALLLCLPGTIFLYQGEELGLPQANVPFEKLKDPEGIAFWPDNLGRDGCRTPMPWLKSAPHAAFSTGDPWLPVDPRHLALAVDQQADDPASALAGARRAIAHRGREPALRLGSCRFLEAPEPVLAFERQHQDQTLLCLFNLSDRPQTFALPEGSWSIGPGSAGSGLLQPLSGQVTVTGGQVLLGPYGATTAKSASG